MVFAISIAIFVFMFRGVIFEHNSFSFRDTPNFHSPLFRLVQDQWRQGQVPLWNPYAVGGMPLLAIGTSAVLYPPKLIFLLPLDFETNFVWFLLVHFLLAMLFQYVLSRRVGCGSIASTVAAIVYAFGGSVLFQYCNVPFLCSVAWMPAALYAAHRAITQRCFVWSAIFGVALAMMVLAGDPQNAYHAVMLASMFAMIYGLGSPNRLMKDFESSGREKGLYSRFLGSSIVSLQVLVIVAAVWGLALSSAQLFPTQELAKLSTRSEWSVPDNIYRIPTYFMRARAPELMPDKGVGPNWYDAILGDPPPPAKQYITRYMYSFVPWRLVELALPNVFGSSEHPSTRWLTRIRGEDPELWLPSVYAGFLPLILAWNVSCVRVSTFTARVKRDNKVVGDQKLTEAVSSEKNATTEDRDDSIVRCWATWVCGLGFLFSFGGYGLVWFVRLISSGSLTHPHEIPGGEVGGGYWFLSTFLPFYADFRYPAKWLTVAALGFAILAGKGYDAVLRSNETIASLSRQMKSMGVFALFVAISLMMLSPFPPAVSSAFLHSGIVAVVCWCWCRQASQTQSASTQALWNVIPVAIIAVDLAIANHWMVHCAPTRARAGVPQLASVIRNHFQDGRGKFPTSAPTPRVYFPDGVIGDDFQLMKGFFAANQNFGYFQPSTGTLQIARNEFYLDSLPYPTERGMMILAPRRALDLWGVDYFVVPQSNLSSETDYQLLGLSRQWQDNRPKVEYTVLPEGAVIVPLDSSDNRYLENISILPNDHAMPDAWVVHRMEVLSPLTSAKRSELIEVMFSIVFPFTGHRDLRNMAIVESTDLIASRGVGLSVLSSPPSIGSVQVIRRAPSELELIAELPSEGLVVLADTYYPGWIATRYSDGNEVPVEILRTNLAMRGILLPEGQHRILMTYSPASFKIGSLISILSLLGLLFIIARRKYFARSNFARAQRVFAALLHRAVP